MAADYGLRTDGLLALRLWRALFPHQPPLLFHEGNQAMIRVVSTGKNPTMRYLARTHRVSVAWLHEVCQMKEIRMCTKKQVECALAFSLRRFRTPLPGGTPVI